MTDVGLTSGQLSASAIVRINSRWSFELYRRPEVHPGAEPGTVAISLGRLLPEAGGPLIIETSSLEWLDALESAIQAARAQGIVQAGMAVRS